MVTPLKLYKISQIKLILGNIKFVLRIILSLLMDNVENVKQIKFIMQISKFVLFLNKD